VSCSTSQGIKVKSVKFESLSPLLSVGVIEPCLPLWTETLGFSNIGEVEHDGKLGFVMLEKDGIVVMYQTFASLDADDAELGRLFRDQKSMLYLKVDDLDTLEKAIVGHEVVFSRRKTFYGADELAIRDAAGHVLVFASFAAESE
jgi:hypothetical protein